jgi:MarR family transcriptional regulator for hemolysin
MDMTYRREQSAGYLTNLAARLFVRAIERRVAGCNAGPMPVFFALAGGGALSQASLARMAMVEQPTMANTLSRMERDGLIERTPDPDDRRSALVRLSPLGLQRAQEGFAAAMEVNGIALSGFTPAERELYLDMLRRVASNLERDGDAQ